MIDQIKREIAIMKNLHHPNIVDLKEVMASKDKIYMVMEFMPGGELFDKIVAEGPLDVSFDHVPIVHKGSIQCTVRHNVFERVSRPTTKDSSTYHSACNICVKLHNLEEVCSCRHMCRKTRHAKCSSRCWMAWITAIDRAFTTGEGASVPVSCHI